MPKSVLTRKRSLIARIAVLAMIFSLMAVALPASATSVALDTTGPCPTATPSAGFTDIGGLDATTQTAINCLFAFGITTGTSATTYSPNDTITRWQMALFLIRQAADHGITIPTAVNQGYTDIGGFDTATQNAINQITQLGISKGTSTTTFSPNDGVTRWQMALFIYRTGQAAGVTFSTNAAHNEFLDIATLSAEAQTAINALADTRPDPEGHIALGTGLSLFSPNLVLVRWQMALFLTRLLAADNIASPAGVRVVVTPTDAVTLATAAGRAFTATFTNADGTPYTGAVGITLKSVVSSVIRYDSTTVPTAGFESVSDGLVAVVGAPTPTIEGFPGTNGIVTFVVRDVAGPTETVVAVAWEDLDNDNTPEISGNLPPAEPYGVGGNTTFAAGPLAECTAVTGSFAGLAVTAVDKANDRFEANGCSLFYDSNDLLLVSGVPGPLADFEAALNVGDLVTSTYAPATADQSTIDISTDNDPALTVTDPAAATSTTATSYLVKGTSVAGYTVRIYADLDDDGTIVGDPAEATPVASGLAAADGTWALSVPLTSGAANNFVATQRALPGDADGPYVNVPTIQQGAAVGVTLVSTVGANAAPSAVGTLSPNDVITITFSGPVTGVGNGDTLSVLDVNGTTATITCGTNATCTLNAGPVPAANTVLTVTLTNVLVTGGTGGAVDTQADITSVSGFTSANGAAVNVAGSGGGKTFTF